MMNEGKWTFEDAKQLSILVHRGASISKIASTFNIDFKSVEDLLIKHDFNKTHDRAVSNRELITLFTKQGYSVNEIAVKIRMDTNYVSTMMRDILNQPKIKQEEMKKSKNYSFYTPDEEKYIFEGMVKGIGAKVIADKLGKTTTSIYAKYKAMREKQVEKTITKASTATTLTKKLTLDDQMLIYKLWSDGKNRSYIADELKIHTVTLVSLWKTTPGLEKAHEEFINKVKELYNSGKTLLEIIKELKSDYARTNEIYLELIKPVEKSEIILNGFGKPLWTEDERNLLIKYTKEGKTINEISNLIKGRSAASVFKKQNRMKLRPVEKRKPVINVTILPEVREIEDKKEDVVEKTIFKTITESTTPVITGRTEDGELLNIFEQILKSNSDKTFVFVLPPRK